MTYSRTRGQSARVKMGKGRVFRDEPKKVAIPVLSTEDNCKNLGFYSGIESHWKILN